MFASLHCTFLHRTFGKMIVDQETNTSSGTSTILATALHDFPMFLTLKMSLKRSSFKISLRHSKQYDDSAERTKRTDSIKMISRDVS
jgi:hypothetical protein